MEAAVNNGVAFDRGAGVLSYHVGVAPPAPASITADDSGA